MSLILYINGELTDLESGQEIARTLQVNDLNSLDNRQASYTNKFRLPKTANNARIMQHLATSGNTSTVPYQKNECSLYSDNGECFVYKGRAVVTDGGENYEVVVYDGIIDLYKAIENKTLIEVGLSDLGHTKSVTEVRDSWIVANNLPYRYILADYNGNIGNMAASPPMVNIDHLVPAVSVAWLWDKVFDHFQTGYVGTVFDSVEFQNLWMTYPKGIGTTDEGTTIFNASQFSNLNPYWNIFDHYWRTLVVRYNDPDVYNSAALYIDADNYRLKVTDPGYYKVSVSGTLNTKNATRLFLAKNVAYTNNAALGSVQMFRELGVTPGHDAFEFETLGFPLAAGDSISLMMRHENSANNEAIRFDGDLSIEVTMKKLMPTNVNFADAFADFSVRDFLSEIVTRFGLTMHKHRYKDEYEFLTLQEQLQTAETVDWSGKFSRKLSENYIYGSYAQRNWFRYNYNDKESTYNDGFVDVANVNLADSKNIIKSKIYSPEKYKTSYLGRATNVYKLWDKEVKDEDGEETISYKALDKRYYFLRAEQKNTLVNLYSSAIEGSLFASSVWVENYWKLPFDDIVQEYYRPLAQILERALIVSAELWLKDTDIANFDFRKLYYFEQLSAYFFMNKISNYVSGKPTKCELVRVVPAAAPEEQPLIEITQVVMANDIMKVYYTVNAPVSTILIEYKRVADSGWYSYWINNITEYWSYPISPPGLWQVRMKLGNIYSNTVQFQVSY